MQLYFKQGKSNVDSSMMIDTNLFKVLTLRK